MAVFNLKGKESLASSFFSVFVILSCFYLYLYLAKQQSGSFQFEEGRKSTASSCLSVFVFVLIFVFGKVAEQQYSI